MNQQRTNDRNDSRGPRGSSYGNNRGRRPNNHPQKPLVKVRPTKLKKKEELEDSLLKTLAQVNGPAPADDSAAASKPAPKDDK